MKILMIGGAGNIGTAIVEEAIKQNHEIFTVTRSGVKWSNSNVHSIIADWFNDEEVKSVFERDVYDVIVDGLMMKLPTAKRDLDYAIGHCKHFIFISSDGVYHRPATNVKEDAHIELEKLKWDIMFNKREIELYIDEHEKVFPYMITTIRPSLTYGENRIPCAIVSRKNQWTLLDRMIKGKPLVFVEDGKSLHPVTPAKVFGEAINAIFLDKRSDREKFHISNDKGYTWDEVAECIGELIGCVPKIVHVPVTAFKKYNRQLYQEVLFDKVDTLTLDNQKIKSIDKSINYNMPLSESLKGTVAFLSKFKSQEPLDDAFNTMCDDILLDNSIKVRDSAEASYVSEFVSNCDEEEKKAIRSKAKRMIAEERKQYLIKTGKRALKRLLPSSAITILKKIKNT